MPRKALIIGIGGQDGSYAAEQLLAEDYAVAGTVTYADRPENRRHVPAAARLFKADLMDYGSLYAALSEFAPDEVYNFGDIDTVGWGRALPELSLQVTAGGPLRLLRAVQAAVPNCRVFQALSGLMFGHNGGKAATESTPLDPCSPYACAKAYAWQVCRMYRAMGMFVSCGIFYNHDSPRRGPDYLLQKICREVVRVQAGRQDHILLGNLTQRLDVGYAPDYTRAAALTLRAQWADDFIISTFQCPSIGEILHDALGAIGLPRWLHAVARPDPEHYTEVVPPPFWGNNRKACGTLGWAPSCGVTKLVDILVGHFVRMEAPK